MIVGRVVPVMGAGGLVSNKVVSPRPPKPNPQVAPRTFPDREALGSDGTTRKAHYGQGKQPWDYIVEAGWAPEFAAGCVLRYLRRDKGPRAQPGVGPLVLGAPARDVRREDRDVPLRARAAPLDPHRRRGSEALLALRSVASFSTARGASRVC